MGKVTNINSPTHIVRFHGGCSGCTQQLVQPEGYDFCVKCKYFDANWSLPDLSNRGLSESESLRMSIKERLGV